MTTTDHPAEPVVDVRDRPAVEYHLWTWVSLLFARANGCGVDKPVFELRIVKTNKGTISGYFDNPKALASAAAQQDAAGADPRNKRPSIYCTLNPVAPELLARACNRVELYVRETTDDANIARRAWLGLDFDPNRPANISSTDAEHDNAVTRARAARGWLTSIGWPEPVFADSGNGAHLDYGVDLPNDAESLALINNCLLAMAAKFGDPKSSTADGGIAFDTSVGNAARIWKIYGTTTRKGDAMPDRPHRVARILELPQSGTLEVVPREKLEILAAMAPQPESSSSGGKSKKSGTKGGKAKGVHEPDLDVPAWLEQHGLKITKTKPYGDGGGGTLWELECCPMDSQHANHAACVIKFATGVVTAGCHHDGCKGKGWREWREKVGEPLPERGRGVAPNPYTNEEIATFATGQSCTVDEFKRRWIIQQGTAFYVFVDGRYLSPILKGELAVSLLPRDLARVPPPSQTPAGIEPWVFFPEGGSRLKTPDEILADHATVARKTVANMMLRASLYDPISQTFFEAACPLRPIAPAFDPEIDKWLRLLGGKSSEKLLDWVATATNLARVTCSLYLHGPKDAGKTMLAEGLARLWGNAATELRSLTGNFNSALLNSPLVFADEEVPQTMTSGFLRALVGSASRALRRKFLPEAELLGAVRLVIAANNADLLKFDDEDFSGDDIEAVGARILYIQPDPSTADYLRSLGGRTATEGWVENGDKIAAHALWLRDHRTVVPGSRFLVEGLIDTIHRRLATHGSIRGLVIEWICKALLLQSHTHRNPGIQYGGGKLYVNATHVQATWERVLCDKRVPSLSKIGRALKPLARGERRLPFEDRRADFYDIDPAFIYSASRELQIGTVDEYQALIEAPRAYLDVAGAATGRGAGDADAAPGASRRDRGW